jgi:hypothetical protein
MNISQGESYQQTLLMEGRKTAYCAMLCHLLGQEVNVGHRLLFAQGK